MQSNCITEASKACLKTFCINPDLSLHLPDTPNLEPTTNNNPVSPRQNFVSAIISSIHPNTNFTNHESLPSLSHLFSALTNSAPYYLNTVLADHIRAHQYPHLSGRACLDYVGHGLFSCSQKRGLAQENKSSTSSSSSSNSPFFEISYSPTSLSSHLLYGSQESSFQAQMRSRISRFMNLVEEDYSSVFVANQTSAFKILADSYPFRPNQNLLTVYDYENEAVQVMVESARKRDARALSAVFSWPSFKVNSRKLRKIVVGKSKSKNRGLFAFPLQSRMTGSRYSYQWMNLARENGWHVLLDASALGAKDMETLGLSLFQPDFLICSFFKIFGENPSGFCCLYIKKSSVSDLSQSTASMGIISLTPTTIDENTESQTATFPTYISQQTIDPEKRKAKSSEIVVELDESPNLDATNCPEPEFQALDHADELGLVLISARTRCLVNWLVNALLSLRHPHSENGLPLVRIYGPRIQLDRGPALAFNVYDWKGERVDPVLVQKLADRNNVSLTVGFLKNIWFSDHCQEDREKVLQDRGNVSRQGLSNDAEEKTKGKQDLGVFVVSVSIGMLSNFEDMYRVWVFAARFSDADFVEKERWRYTALNQATVEL
ncbi:Pyridoxal phosphate (PLP)-dependent transferases superfamily protein [Striga hermonthica]|uniref:Pyridoxal phosphate (PLP)-dependent transferases superfamily protein n=1 Tax=Striga hermonthica TaxID=68872 RepID=A0A9N7NSY4_STRHE|nr:Pyridoxal phosphate (PLP)-dependent transferases superfamily protein [Striga hermonthica]